MKYVYLLLIFPIFFLYLFISNVNAQNVKYNPNCTFYPKIELINYTMKLYGPEEFNEKLIQNTGGFILFGIKSLGNWTDLRHISATYTIYCGGEERTFGGPADLIKTYSENDTTITEFIWNNRFLIPEKRFCYAVGEILGINETWQDMSHCSYCACRINGLSYYSYTTSETSDVITLQEFLLQKQLEEQKSQGILNEQMRDLTIAIYVLTILTTIINKDFRYFIEKNKTFIGFATFLLVGINTFQNTTLNFPTLLSQFSGITMIIFSIIVLLNKYFLRKFLDKILALYLMILLIFYLFFGIMFTLLIFIFLFSPTNYLFSGIMIILDFVAFLATFYLLRDYYFNILRKRYKRATRRFESFIKKLFY